MTGKQRVEQSARKKNTNEKYLSAVFSILKKREGIVVSGAKTHFNDTELRLIGAVLSAKSEGKRLISTQLATRLGVTRSAISQIVNRLEESGVVKRVPDAVDRKIAYIEVTDETMTNYREDIKTCGKFIGKVVENFGEEKFDQMCGLVEEFMGLIEAEKQQAKASCRQKKTKTN